MFNVGSAIKKDDLILQLEKNTKKEFTPEALKLIEDIGSSSDFDSSTFKERLISFSSIATGQKKSTAIDYVKAVQYCSYIAVGDSQITAYSKTFPDRIAAKKSAGAIRACANMYHHTDMVKGILEQSSIGLSLVFMSQRFQASAELYDIGTDTKVSPKVRVDALNNFLTQTKPPETSKLEVQVGFKNNEAIADLEDTLTRLAHKQLEMIEGGHSTAADIVDADIISQKED